MKINKVLKDEYKLTNDGDPWGNCMQWLFAVCDYLTFETDECVPNEWHFRASPCGSDEKSYVFQSLKELSLPDQEILEFGKVLIRLRDILEKKGLSY